MHHDVSRPEYEQDEVHPYAVPLDPDQRLTKKVAARAAADLTDGDRFKLPETGGNPHPYQPGKLKSEVSCGCGFSATMYDEAHLVDLFEGHDCFLDPSELEAESGPAWHQSVFSIAGAWAVTVLIVATAIVLITAITGQVPR